MKLERCINRQVPGHPFIGLVVLMIFFISGGFGLGSKALQAATPVDAAYFSALQTAVEKYRSGYPKSEKMKLFVNKDEGVIKSNWFPAAGSSARVKFKIMVSGKTFEIQTWEREDLIIAKKNPDTAQAKQLRQHLQMNLNKNLQLVQDNSL